jgi:Ca-activated chloride channel family protein
VGVKASRLLLLAAAHLCCAGLMSEAALAGNASSLWSDLWRTPDQQGQALLDAGKPALAAARFHDPQRRAYADIEAGRYPQAAKLLAPYTDPESEYNRGNALAESGQLQPALAAYDAALKQAPTDADIRHNRDLVERELRKQQQSQSSSGGGKGGQGSGSGQQQRSGGGQRSGSGSRKAGGGSQRSGNRGTQSGGGNRSASNGSHTGAGQSAAAGQKPASPQATNGPGNVPHSPGQARRDAAFAAALARAQKQNQGKGANPSQEESSQRNGASKPGSKGAARQPDNGRFVAGGNRTPKQKPETEQQLALDQWLRQIPDSPAGLLRRKFLIEHMMKQQGDQGPQGGTQ